MPDQTFDLRQQYLLLESDGTAIGLPGGDTFWQELMSGNPQDPGVRRLADSRHGRLVSAYDMDTDWPNWEKHPAGDELLVMLAGQATFRFEVPQGIKEVVLGEGRALVVPRGVWHTARIAQPIRLLAVTSGHGTEHRPV